MYQGIAGAIIFLILLVLLVWMICVRSARNRQRSSEKFAPSVGDMTGSQVNFYYGAPAPYAESIAPSHHGSTYAHYYEDEEDGWYNTKLNAFITYFIIHILQGHA